ncbi:MAG: hypothetical protein A3H42_03065 [Deltaproteobacteria bacterium RIFCSPLOWO2_02_FULL_46_8]|nr:MAG: hypothetical protein A3H42_03065 [Deltaproteobacteria bacterium RIFCSPLOWO2_02_FULL_46_8]
MTAKSGRTSVLPISTEDAMNKRAAEEAVKSDVKAVKKRTVVASDRLPLPPKLVSDYQPVANVRAQEAQYYCEAQLDENGKPGRLPTNDEWEKMARGPKGFDFGTSDGTLKCGKNASCDAEASSVVGSFAASGFGTYDTVGNVGEWTKESNGDTYIRGGSWLVNVARYLRADYRYNDFPDYLGYYVGFRCVWSQERD